MTTEQTLTLVSLLFGIMARIAIPWLQVRKDDPTMSWSWQYVWPEVLGFLIVILSLPMLVPDLHTILDLPFQAAWLIGVGAAEAGNVVVGRPVRRRLAKN